MEMQRLRDTIETLIAACSVLGIKPTIRAGTEWRVADFEAHILTRWPVSGQARQKQAQEWISKTVIAAENRQPATAVQCLKNVMIMNAEG